jgi:hypothetical protein
LGTQQVWNGLTAHLADAVDGRAPSLHEEDAYDADALDRGQAHGWRRGEPPCWRDPRTSEAPPAQTTSGAAGTFGASTNRLEPVIEALRAAVGVGAPTNAADHAVARPSLDILEPVVVGVRSRPLALGRRTPTKR